MLGQGEEVSGSLKVNCPSAPQVTDDAWKELLQQVLPACKEHMRVTRLRDALAVFRAGRELVPLDDLDPVDMIT